jgi:hypothetical protein
VRGILKDLTGIVTTHKKNVPSVPLPGPHVPGVPERLSASGMALMNPCFDADVLHADNRALFNKTADLAVHSINVSQHTYIQINIAYLL